MGFKKEKNVKTNVDKIQKLKVKRKFVGNESLGNILASVFESQVDNIVESIYHTTRANTVTSQTTQTEGDELL